MNSILPVETRNTGCLIDSFCVAQLSEILLTLKAWTLVSSVRETHSLHKIVVKAGFAHQGDYGKDQRLALQLGHIGGKQRKRLDQQEKSACHTKANSSFFLILHNVQVS